MPPMSANMPGFSPSNISTHTGFSRGSTAPSRQHASGGQYFVDFTYRIYAIPSWNTPSIIIDSIAVGDPYEARRASMTHSRVTLEKIHEGCFPKKN